mgnify:CR=1 FL=1
MGFHIYLEQELQKRLDAICASLGKKRNTAIREAVREYVEMHSEKEWPDLVNNFKPIRDFEPFEKDRKELLPPSEDMLS